MYIFVPENEFPEIIYTVFGLGKTIFLTIFGTKFVVICAANNFENRLTNKEFMPKLNFE